MIPEVLSSFEGERYDVGEKLGFVKTTIEYALKDDSMREELTRSKAFSCMTFEA